MSHRDLPRTGRGCFSAVLALPVVILGGGLALLVLFGWGERHGAPGGRVEVTSLPVLASARPDPTAVAPTRVEQPVALREEVRAEQPPTERTSTERTPPEVRVPRRTAPPPAAAVSAPTQAEQPPTPVAEPRLARAEAPTTTSPRRLLSPVLPPPPQHTTEAAVPAQPAAVEPTGTESPIPPTTT